jgi:tetratricopeptide (TPR) repeat protein
MRHRPVVILLMLIIAMILALPAGAQQKPFTQDQVQGMVRSGLGDEAGAKAIEQRGFDFVPTEDFLQGLKAAGANEAFLQALRTARHRQPPGEARKKPLNKVQVFALLTGQVTSHRIAMLVQERGINFEPTDDYVQEVRLAGGEDQLISALKGAKVTKPEHVDPALQARQREIHLHTARGAECLQKKQYVDAESEFRTAVRLDPQNSDLHFNLGCALDLNGNSEGAIAEYRRALRLNPESDHAHFNLGSVLGGKGDWDGEIAEEREALRLDPDNDYAHFNLAMALAHKGDREGEVAEFREALRLNPANETVHVYLGTALGFGYKGDWDGAIAECREALRLEPKDDQAHVCLGSALEGKGDSDGAVAEYREALNLNPTNDLAHAYLGWELGQNCEWDTARCDWDAAVEEERQALRLNPNSAFAHYHLGVAIEKKGDQQGALQEFRAAYELDPQNPAYRKAYQRLVHEVNH